MPSTRPSAQIRKIPSDVKQALVMLLTSSNHTLTSPELRSGAAISFRQQFYRWRTSVLDAFVDLSVPGHFKTHECDQHLHQAVRGLNSDILQRIEMVMHPKLSIPSQVRKLELHIKFKLVFMQVNKDGSLSPIDITREHLEPIRQSNEWDFGNGVRVKQDDFSLPNDPKEQAQVEAIIRAARAKPLSRSNERSESPSAALQGSAKPSAASQSGRVAAKPQWVIDLELAQARERKILEGDS